MSTAKEEVRVLLDKLPDDFEPKLELAKNYRLTKIQLKAVEAIIQEHYDEFKAAWNSHFRD